MRIYHYNWGNEDVLGSEIEITNDSNNMYTIIFKQQGHYPNLFSNLKIRGEIVSKTDNLTKDKYEIYDRTIIIKFKAILNPKPEELFEFIEQIE